MTTQNIGNHCHFYHPCLHDHFNGLCLVGDMPCLWSLVSLSMIRNIIIAIICGILIIIAIIMTMIIVSITIAITIIGSSP